MKLTKAQKEVIEALKAGGTIWNPIGALSAYVVGVPGKRDRKVRRRTLGDLDRLGLVEAQVNENQNVLFADTHWVLTKKGKEA